MTPYCLDLRSAVIEPALHQAQLSDPGLPAWLEAVASAQCQHSRLYRFGPFGMTAWQHKRVWDEYIAQWPELACQVRGLASQRRFLTDPHQELCLNWGYATALAALNARFHAGGSVDQLSTDQAIELWRQACHRGRRVDDSLFRRTYASDLSTRAA
ncbi:hypothetical protein BGP77_07650 [Saccharospirillum sp. MSK14-1]|uniref:hypothetical protein n=1 Tax=Saccharospirillum sp. MSK14-1 TaxID=1897632 RepID=UPI000D3A3B1F|nr:hypothetical protein [Saccharospirillum sp. MSK14-1]PTY37135.1 hypothetical protein BGP77_07650 [Saccharospirillum sp. MSK14-1]